MIKQMFFGTRTWAVVDLPKCNFPVCEKRMSNLVAWQEPGVQGNSHLIGYCERHAQRKFKLLEKDKKVLAVTNYKVAHVSSIQKENEASPVDKSPRSEAGCQCGDC